MIRINLLEQPKARQPRQRSRSGVPLIVGAFLAGLIISLSYLGISYRTTSKELEGVHSQSALVSAQIVMLQQADFEMRQIRQQQAEIQQQLEAVKRLSAGRTGGEELLSKLVVSVGRTDGLWLTSFQRKGSAISVQGQAVSMVAVANLITALRNSGYFAQVEISEAKEDDSDPEALTYSFAMAAQVGGVAAKGVLAGGKS